LTREAPPVGDRTAQAVFALLVVACFAAFFVTQRLKHTPTAVQRFQLTPFFSPTPAGHVKEERISFKLAAAEGVTVTIVNSAGDTVATLARDRPVPRYKQFKLSWNGQLGMTDSGARAPAGEYRVHVHLLKQRRWVFSPRSFTLVRR
jgi:FlgD Ig-like domain